MRISSLRGRKPRDISGGERQRVALARTLVTEPCVLLLDEPLAALDAPTKSRIIDDLHAWNDGRRIPVLYVTHSREEVFALAGRVIVFEHGSIVAEGSPHDVLETPRHESAAEWAGFENLFDATILREDEERGTTTVVMGDVKLEIPLSRRTAGQLRIGIRAGDILLATQEPGGISARNVIPGQISRFTRRDAMMVAQVECGITLEVHVTPHAMQALGLQEGSQVWLIIKTHSCHPLRRSLGES
jgi:molybdate transport system ATP-binding protein